MLALIRGRGADYVWCGIGTGTGIPGVTVVIAAPESDLPTEDADLVVDGPDGIAALFTALADALERSKG